MTTSPGYPQDADEIDLIEVARSLWSQKAMIALIALAVTLAAAAYAFLSKPVYEAKLFLQPPTYNSIAEFNYGRTKEADLDPYSVADVYNIFIRRLQSESLRRAFFEDVYLPSLSEEQRQGSRELLYAALIADISVSSVKGSSDRYAISARSDSAPLAVEWIVEYLKRADQIAKTEMIRNVTREAEVRARNIEQQIDTLRISGKEAQEDTVVQLREALRIAESIGLEDPPLISGSLSSEVSATMDGQLTYMRGAKALRAEIENLVARTSNDPFINNLRGLQIKAGFYHGLHVNAEDVALFRQDGDVEQPDRPIKPRKAIILILGFMLGVTLGLLVGMVRYCITRMQSRQVK
jgi:chain length determinant protein (polysaccharide antigen chain regulator)